MIKHSTGQRDYDLDLIKAISIVLVLFWHLQPIRFTVKYKTISSIIIANLINIINVQVCLIAVPLLYIVFLYLFYRKIQNQKNYFINRELRIFYIFLFWLGIQFLIYYIMVQDAHDHILSMPLIRTILIGGPGLPYVYGSVFYFLSNMVFLAFIAYLFTKLKNETLKTLMSLFLVMFFLIFFEINQLRGHAQEYWRIENFIVYIPLVYLIARYPDMVYPGRYFFLLGYIFFSVKDYLMGVSSAYARISIFMGAMTFFSFLFKRNFREVGVVKFLARYSLGIFALHKYWQLLLIILIGSLFSTYGFQGAVGLSSIQIDLLWFYASCAAIVVTLVSVPVLGRTPLKRFLR